VFRGVSRRATLRADGPALRATMTAVDAAKKNGAGFARDAVIVTA